MDDPLREKWARECLVETLEYAGFDPIEVKTDVAAAIAFVTERRADLRLVFTFHHETSQPDLGKDFHAEELIANAAKNRIPVVVVAGDKTDIDSASKSQAPGAVISLIIPFDSLVVKKTDGTILQNLLKGNRATAVRTGRNTFQTALESAGFEF